MHGLVTLILENHAKRFTALLRLLRLWCQVLTRLHSLKSLMGDQVVIRGWNYMFLCSKKVMRNQFTRRERPPTNWPPKQSSSLWHISSKLRCQNVRYLQKIMKMGNYADSGPLCQGARSFHDLESITIAFSTKKVSENPFPRLIHQRMYFPGLFYCWHGIFPIWM